MAHGDNLESEKEQVASLLPVVMASNLIAMASILVASLLLIFLLESSEVLCFWPLPSSVHPPLLLGTKGIATMTKDATRGTPGIATSHKKLLIVFVAQVHGPGCEDLRGSAVGDGAMLVTPVRFCQPSAGILGCCSK